MTGKPREQWADRDRMVELHTEGRSVSSIASTMGVAYMTVHRGLTARGVLEKRGRGKGGGRPRPAKCKRGHDQKTWRREDRRGRGFCGKCKTLRDKGKLK